MSNKRNSVELEISRAESVIRRLTPRSPEQSAQKQEIVLILLSLRSQLGKALVAYEFQLLHRQASDLRAQASSLLKGMPPSGRVFLTCDGFPSIEEEDDDAGFKPDSHEYIVSGDFEITTQGGSIISLKHGTEIRAQSFSGMRVKLTLPGGVEVLLSENDFPLDGIPVERPGFDEVFDEDDKI